MARKPKISQGLRELPNKLTLARIAGIPLLLAVYPWDINMLRWIGAVLFALAAVTDYLDGYLARKYDAVTKLGAIIDPISDKILVTSAVVLITYTQQLQAWIAALILCREVAVSGMRLAASELGLTISVSQLGKYKTALQDTAIFLIMLSLPSLKQPAMIILWLSILVSYVSAWQYAQKLWQTMNQSSSASSDTEET